MPPAPCSELEGKKRPRRSTQRSRVAASGGHCHGRRLLLFLLFSGGQPRRSLLAVPLPPGLAPAARALVTHREAGDVVLLRSPRQRSLPRRSATLGAALQQSAKRSRAGSRPSSYQTPLAGRAPCWAAAVARRAATPPSGARAAPGLAAEGDTGERGRRRGRQLRRDGSRQRHCPGPSQPGSEAAALLLLLHFPF